MDNHNKKICFEEESGLDLSYILSVIQDINNKTLQNERDLYYFKNKELEQNGLLRELAEKTEKLNTKIDSNLLSLHEKISNLSNDLTTKVYKMLFKQTLLLMSGIIAPIVVFLILKHLGK